MPGWSPKEKPSGIASARFYTGHQQVAGPNPSHPAVECNPGQVVNTHVPLSPSSTIWYQPIRAVMPCGRHYAIGLALHWPRVTNISGSPPTGSRPGRGRWGPTYALLCSMVDFTFSFLDALPVSKPTVPKQWRNLYPMYRKSSTITSTSPSHPTATAISLPIWTDSTVLMD